MRPKAAFVLMGAVIATNIRWTAQVSKLVKKIDIWNIVYQILIQTMNLIIVHRYITLRAGTVIVHFEPHALNTHFSYFSPNT